MRYLGVLVLAGLFFGVPGIVTCLVILAVAAGYRAWMNSQA